MAVENYAAKAKTKGYSRLISSLIETVRKLSDKLTLNDLLQTVTSEAEQIFGANAVWILFYDQKEDLLKMHHYWGPCVERFTDISVKPGIGIPGKVFLTQRSEINLEPEKQQNTFDGNQAFHKDPVIATHPLTVGKKKIGILGLASENIGGIGLSKIELDFLISAFASQVAVSIENARLFEEKSKLELELKESIQNLEVLNEIGTNLVKDLELPLIMLKVARYTAEIMGADAAIISLGNKAGTAIEEVYSYNMPPDAEKTFLTKKTIARSVFKQPRRILLNDYPNHPWAIEEFVQAGTKGLILVPVTSKDRVLATLSAVSFRDDHKFSVHDFNKLESIKYQVAIAIENARLYQEQVKVRREIEAYANKLRLLNSFSRNIIKEAAPEKMVKKLVNSARSLLDCGTAAIVLFKEGDWGRPNIIWSSDEGCTEVTAYKSVDKMIHIGIRDGWIGIKRPLRLQNKVGGCINYDTAVEHPKLQGLLSVPLLDSEGNYMGQLLVTGKKDKSDFTEADEDLLIALCSQVAIGIERAQAFEKEHGIAETLQQAILEVPKDLPGLEIGIIYESAAEVAKVGGDFYDLFEVGEGKIGILIGDVSGKGLEAATITSIVKSTIRAFAYKGLPPKLVLTEANRAICRQLRVNQFVTMIYSVIDLEAGKLITSHAGHPKMILWREDKCELCEAESNLPIGIFREVNYEENEIDLAIGDGVILYTDGLTEARYEGKLFGEDALIEELNSLVSGKNPQQIALELVNMAKRFADGKPQDDIAIIALRIKSEHDG